MFRVLFTRLQGLPSTAAETVRQVGEQLQWELDSSLSRCDQTLPLVLSYDAAVEALSSLLAELPTARCLVLGPNDVSAALWSLRHGASDYLAVEEARNGAHFEARLKESLLQLAQDRTPRPVSCSGSGQRVFRLARRVAPTDVSVLLQGPSGSGKEVLARFIHEHSRRATRRFVAVNCAAMPETMLESLLFGHERGAFTGADRRRDGKFLLASGGTLLLDEVTEMPIELQAKLLRAIQEQEIEPLGARESLSVDVRVLATTNREPAIAIAEGRLREDLYYRLNVFPLRVPGLVERPEDIAPLAQQLLRRHGTAQQIHAGFSDAALRILQGYRWPGNVRELENVVQRALVLTEAGPIEVPALGLAPDRAASPEPTDLKQQLDATEDDAVLEALQRHGYKRRPTAEFLGISERTLRNKLRKLRAAGRLEATGV